MPLPQSQVRELSSAPTRHSLQLDSFIEDHSGLLAGAILLAAFLVRVWAAWGTFLNSDEILNCLVADQRSWTLVYHASLHQADPPLLNLLLHAWFALGRSEFVLRLPSVIAGTAFCLVFYQWVSELLGTLAGWIALILVSFLPPMVLLSAEVRQYSFMLLLLASAALLTEQWFARKSAVRILLNSICLGLAILFHYSALLCAATIGIYSLVRLSIQGPRRLVFAWIIGDSGLAALFVFLYRTHISPLKASRAAPALEGWLRNSFYHPGHDNLLLFLVARTFGVFQFTFGQLAVGDVACVVFASAIVLLIRRRISTAPSGPAPPLLALFFVLPFLLNLLAATAGFYPYGGTRHSVFIAIFVIAGISAFVAYIINQRVLPGLAVAVLVVFLCVIFGRPHRPYMSRSDQSRAHMSQAVNFIEQKIPRTQPLIADYQTGLELTFYLCGPQPPEPDRSVPGFVTRQCAGHTIIVTSPENYIFNPANFPHTWNTMLGAYGATLGDSLWVVQAGWDANLLSELQSRPDFRDFHAQRFGRNISLFQMSLRTPVPASLK